MFYNKKLNNVLMLFRLSYFYLSNLFINLERFFYATNLVSILFKKYGK